MLNKKRNLNKKDNKFFIFKGPIVFGIFLMITHALIWFVPAYLMGSIPCRSYKFISIFPVWFVGSIFGSFIIVIFLIIIFVLFNKE